MSADLLRRAAALMRERAEAARSGEWFADTTGGDADVRAAWRFGACDIAVCEGSLPEGNAANAEHIASWHPAVALAVADWLEAEAASLEAMAVFSQAAATIEHEVNIRGAAITVHKSADGAIGLRADTSSPALAVARAFLGESS